MIGLDRNILVQLAIASHAANARTVAAVQNDIQKGETLVFPSLIVSEFLHIVTDDRRFAPPLTMMEALDWIDELLKNPSVSLLEPGSTATNQTLQWIRQFKLGRKRILDTQLAAIFHCHGVHRLLTSNPADFAVLGAFETIVP